MSETFDDHAKFDKILIISDVHGLLGEMEEFFEELKKKHGNTISCGIHLGDLFKGRNVIFGQKTFSFWKDLSFLEKIPFPFYCTKGNEDINIPDDWWHRGNLVLLPDKEEFMLNDFRTISVNYIENENKEFYHKLGIKKLFRLKPKPIKGKYFPMFDFKQSEHSESADILESSNKIDFIFSHVPPFGLLDKTRDYATHREIRFTGSRFVRLLIDRRKPAVVFFGHNHFSNYATFGDLLVVSIDKFCRKIPVWADENTFFAKKSRTLRLKSYTRDKSVKAKEKNIYSYCIIRRDRETFIIDMFRKNNLIFQYDLLKKKIILSKIK
jgi:Icc-related predicted phosphoesterase